MELPKLRKSHPESKITTCFAAMSVSSRIHEPHGSDEEWRYLGLMAARASLLARPAQGAIGILIGRALVSRAARACCSMCSVLETIKLPTNISKYCTITFPFNSLYTIACFCSDIIDLARSAAVSRLYRSYGHVRL